MVKTTYYPLAILQSLPVCKSPFILTFRLVQVTMAYRVFIERLSPFRKMLTLSECPPQPHFSLPQDDVLVSER